MIKDKIVFCGIGQCGGNIVKELEQEGFNAYYVNTSLEDLETIPTSKENKYHINGTKGMAKDRQKALSCLLTDDITNKIVWSLSDRYPMADIIYMVYSSGGGTGGGMGNILCEVMTNEFHDKYVNAVVVLPHDSEDIGVQVNSIECVKQLRTLLKEGSINNVHILDNKSRDNKMKVNKDFAITFSNFCYFNDINENGNLDEEELEKVLIEAGVNVILDFENEDFANGLSEATDSTIYAEWLKDSTLHGLILNNKQNDTINKKIIKEVVGIAQFTHEGTWNNGNNIIFATGMSFNNTIINNMTKSANDMIERKKKLEEESIASASEDTIELNIKELNSRNQRGNRRSSTSQQTTPMRSRRNNVSSVSSVLDKYRNM